VANVYFAKAHAVQSSCRLCNSIKGLLSSNSRLLFVFLTDLNRTENMKNIPLFNRLQRCLRLCFDPVLGFVDNFVTG